MSKDQARLRQKTRRLQKYQPGKKQAGVYLKKQNLNKTI